MADVINLNRFRKKRLKEDKARKADANRVKHGRTKAERAEERARKDLAARRLDGHKLTESPPDSDSDSDPDPTSAPTKA